MAHILFKVILYIVLAALLLRAAAIIAVVMAIWALYWVFAE
jgi:hypothetical protein